MNIAWIYALATHDHNAYPKSSITLVHFRLTRIGQNYCPQAEITWCGIELWNRTIEVESWRQPIRGYSASSMFSFRDERVVYTSCLTLFRTINII